MDVLDLAAGTGKLSRVLLALGHRVTAMEPDEQMREQFARSTPGLTALAGTAEEIALPDGAVDAVVVGQAYHWFDPVRAHPEVARVLRPGGVFAPMWNDEDPATPWTVRYAEIIDGVWRDQRPDHSADSFGPRFGPVRSAEFRHEIDVSVDGLLAIATTRSPYLTGTPQTRQEMLDAIHALANGPELAGRATFPMPHLTHVSRAVRL
jgi:SAM-dependent methyltransferase